MNYNFIINPINGKKYSIFSRKANKILINYLKLLKQTGGSLYRVLFDLISQQSATRLQALAQLPVLTGDAARSIIEE